MRYLLIVVVVGLLPANSHGRDVLAQLNHNRVRHGLRPYLPAPELHNAAEAAVYKMAGRGYLNKHHGLKHRGMTSGIGEGPGRDIEGRNFHSCGSMSRIPRGTHAAASVATSRHGSYYCLDVRESIHFTDVKRKPARKAVRVVSRIRIFRRR